MARQAIGLTSFDIDPSGRFLFAARESAARLAGYRIDVATGT